MHGYSLAGSAGASPRVSCARTGRDDGGGGESETVALALVVVAVRVAAVLRAAAAGVPVMNDGSPPTSLPARLRLLLRLMLRLLMDCCGCCCWRPAVLRLRLLAARCRAATAVVAAAADCCGCGWKFCWPLHGLRDRLGCPSSSPPSSESSSPSCSVGAGLRLVVRVLLAELLLRRGDQAEVVLGVLMMRLGGDVVADRRRIARELQILLGDVMRGAADFHLRSVRLVHSRQRIVVVVTAVVVMVLLLLLLLLLLRLRPRMRLF